MNLLKVLIFFIHWLSQINSIILTPNNIADFIQNNDLNFQGITCIDKKDLKNFNSKILDLDNNEISVLPPDLFEDNPHFTKISLFRNKLEVIPELVFRVLANVTYISLSFNKIRKLPANVFKGNFLLISISLRSNSLSVLHDETFINNGNLEFLDLALNNLLKFDYSELLLTSKLKNLYLEGNNLTELNYFFLKENFPQLGYISLTGNRFICALAGRMEEFLKMECIVSVVEFTKPCNISCYIEMNNTLLTKNNSPPIM